MYSNRRSYFKNFLISLAVSLGVCTTILFLGFGYISKNIPPASNLQQENTGIPKVQQMAAEVTTTTFNSVEVAKSALPGVVGVSVLRSNPLSFFSSILGNTTPDKQWGIGSGVIVSPNGYILTNNHIAGGVNEKIVVSLPDGRNVDGQTVWSDKVIDIAIVKVNLTGLKSLKLGDANKLQVGEPAIAIGNPLGLEFQRTVTSGIISALNRTIKVEVDGETNYMEDLIQTDAGINPGNSGGPLLNSQGEVIGINSIKLASAEAIGFAVPINMAIPIINQLNSNQEFEEAYFGVFAYDKNLVSIMDGNIRMDKGIYVQHIDEKSPAYAAGIRKGCIITKIDQSEVNTMMQFRSYLYGKKPGDVVSVTCIKDGASETVSIKLANKDKEGLVTR